MQNKLYLYELFHNENRPYDIEKTDDNDYNVKEANILINEVKLKDCKGYFLLNSYCDDKKNNDYVIYQIHGGSYTKKYNETYTKIAEKYSNLLNMNVFSIDYRIAPEYTYPIALEDAVAGYQYLIEKGYKHIIICGDSAGAGLAISMTMYIRDNLNIPMPIMLLLSSPWTDLTESGASWKSNLPNDPNFGWYKKEYYKKYPIINDYAGDNELTNKYISPLYGNFENMPKMLIQVGSQEILLSDSVELYNKAIKYNKETKIIVYPAMWHTFYYADIDIPEINSAWNEIKNYVNKYI